MQIRSHLSNSVSVELNSLGKIEKGLENEEDERG